MGNVNFSADMIGIQTLAQQGRASVQDGEAMAVGSFEGMIMQLIADNMTVLPKQNTEIISTEKKGEDQDVVIDAIMNGMISPDVQMIVSDKLFAEVNVPEVLLIQNNVPVQGNVLDTVVQSPVAYVQNSECVIQKITASDAMNIQTDVVADVEITDVSFTDIIRSEVTEVVQNVSDDGAEIIDTTNTDNNQLGTESVQISGGTDKVAMNLINENDTMDSEFAGKPESFISTEDMLMMRAGNKIDFSADKAVFKVADAPVNIESPTAVTDLTDKILMKFTENEFEVELYPKNLGKITVSLVVEDGVVNVALSSTNDKVNEFLVSQSANIQNIVEKNTHYQTVVKLDESQEQYQQQRDNAQHGADENQKNRQQEHLQQLYSQNMQHTTEDFLSMLRLV